MLIGNKYNAS